jgi:Ca2+-transporting ATPase
VHHGLGEHGTRTLVFTALVVANIALTLVDRSFEHGVHRTLRYPNRLLRGIVAGTVLLLVLLLTVPLLRDFFRLAPVTPIHLAAAVGMGLASVLWYEGVKLWKRKKG